MKYALDTNIIILLLRDNANVRLKFDKAVEYGDELIIPPLVHYEMRRGFRYKNAPKKEKAYQILTARYPVSEMSVESLEYAADLYANLRLAGRTIEDMDLLIAAFCITNGYTLITHNTRHFEDIENLSIEDWST